MKSIKFLLPSIIVLLFISNQIIAQRGRAPLASPELRAEMKAYFQENIQPTLLTQRAKLETQLSTTDQAQIDQIRTAQQTLEPQMKALREEMRSQKTKWRVLKRRRQRKNQSTTSTKNVTNDCFERNYRKVP